MTTQFVTIYHPALANVQKLVPLLSVETWEERGWLLVDPGITPPPVEPYLTQAAGDSRYIQTGAAASLVGGVVPDSQLPTRLSTAALSTKADLSGGVVPDAQLPTRLSDVSLKAAIDAETAAVGVTNGWVHIGTDPDDGSVILLAG